MKSENEILLKMDNIDKSFPGIKALQSINLFLEEGEVLALVGENGAGKSTLIKILSGVYSRDRGDIYLDGNRVEVNNPKEAEDLGISTIYQDINIVQNLTVAENIFLGREINQGFGLISKNKMFKKAKELCNFYDVDLEVDITVRNLSIAKKQMVLVIKALAFKSKIVIMDEATAFLTKNEIDKFYMFIDILKKKGVGIIYISHNLQEIFKVSDNIMVLRDGKNVGEKLKTKNADINQLVKMMVGRSIENYYPKRVSKIGDVVLEVNNLSRGKHFENVSFELRKGEVLGVYGLVGAGRSELVETIFGIYPVKSKITVNDKNYLISSPEKAIRAEICLVPEDRRVQGLVLTMNLRENLSLSRMKYYSRLGFLLNRLEKKVSNDYIKKLKIKVTNSEQAVENLSGGNQQKVVLAKWLQTKPQILILDEPTKGIDIGAKVEIYNLINNLASDERVGIILISSELPEVLAMSDRVMIMFKGRLAKILSKDEANPEIVLKYATGILN